MTAWAKVFIGVVFFLMGLGYLYRPDLIERMNAFVRETFFNDAHLALERRKWGVFFLLVSLLFVYLGYTALQGKP